MSIDLTSILAIYGAILSTLLLVWKIVVYYLDNTPRLKVEVEKGLMMTSLGDYESQIHIRLSNIGKPPITVSSGKFVMENNDLHLVTLELPKKIEAGQNHVIHINVEGIKTDLKKTTNIPEYVVVTDQTGKRYKSKKLSKSVINLLQ